MHRLFLLLTIFSTGLLAAAPRITLVTGNDALEQKAAAQLAADLKSLFDAEATIIQDKPTDAGHIIFIGSPNTNPAIAKADFPKLTAQGHALKSTPAGLIVGGGSPQATLWAASELSYRWGIRALLHGDALPIDRPTLKLEGWDVLLEPTVPVRAWSGFSSDIHSAQSWTLEEQTRLMTQLVKLRFTHIVIPETTAGFSAIPVDGDTAGRTAFKGAKTFAPPAAADHLSQLAIQAESLGLQVLRQPPDDAKVITPNGTRASVLPQFSLSALEVQGPAVVVEVAHVGDLNPAVHFLSRRFLGLPVEPQQALTDLVTPICGEGVAERLWKGFTQVEQAAKLIQANDPTLGVPEKSMFLKHHDASKPVPAWITELKTLYTGAMGEMYRGNTRARGGARPFILYHAKRLEFALHFCTTLESLHLPKDQAAEAAPEAIYNALNAHADVARDSSDRAVIAQLNVHGYLPILDALQ